VSAARHARAAIRVRPGRIGPTVAQARRNWSRHALVPVR
jgi:hypothetical protein